MRFIRPITFSVIMALAACQGDANSPTISSKETAADVTLRATSDIQTPSPIRAASFVPNSVATWLGHIILLDEKGTLHRATTDSVKTDVVALGKYKDVIGLAREKKSGAFLALTSQGRIKAFVQTDDEGNFGPMAASQSDETYARFCTSTEPSSSIIWAETTSGVAQKLTIEIFEDTSVTFKSVSPLSGDVDVCASDKTLYLGAGYSLKPDNASTRLTLSKDKADLFVEITNGLSIAGIKNAGFVTVTNTNMGSVFNEGVMLVAEKDEGRLVLVSRSYVLKELESR